MTVPVKGVPDQQQQCDQYARLWLEGFEVRAGGRGGGGGGEGFASLCQAVLDRRFDCQSSEVPNGVVLDLS